MNVPKCWRRTRSQQASVANFGYEIAQINCNREQLEGIIQARYGYAKDQVKKDVDDWLNRMCDCSRDALRV